MTDTAPPVDPAGFTADITNPYLPLRPGSRWVYEGRSEDGFERKVVEVTDETRTVMGVTCVVVKDTVTLDGQPYEETFDWFAEDRAGAVWNFGEATRKRTDDGNFTPAGSWEAGLNRAQPGVVMPADPEPGGPYRQEYLPGEAEDSSGPRRRRGAPGALRLLHPGRRNPRLVTPRPGRDR